MPKKTQVKEPNDWEDVAGIGPTRAERLRESVGSYGEFRRNSTNAQKNKIASAVTGDRRNLPQFAENAIDAASSRSRSADVVDSDLVETRQVDKRAARTRSKTKIKGREADADRSDLGFETMERDPNDLDRAAKRFTSEYDDPLDPSAKEIGDVARERQDPNDRATFQPLIGAATSRTVFASTEPGAQFRQDLERTVEQTDRATASPGELADAFVDFVDQDIGLRERPGGFRGVSQPTDIGREPDGEFGRPDTAAGIDPAPVARNSESGEFGLDPFDITANGVGDSVDLFGGDR